MPPAKAAGGELKSKSPAEFFAEHQNIAGFDNPGKSLYTTIRELVENSLDAAEAIQQLPDIKLTVERLDVATFNQLRGIQSHERSSDHKASSSSKKKKLKKSPPSNTAARPTADLHPIDEFSLIEDTITTSTTTATTTSSTTATTITATSSTTTTAAAEAEVKSTDYFRITCWDNGSGMEHTSIPKMLAIVLSSTKYGVKQTRGKFGLGAKMALVWAKKSTGLPIHILSSTSTSASALVSDYLLDIDIYKNQPHILEETRASNTAQWRGSEVSVVITGNWSTYQAKVISYLRQLAVITPYANLLFNYIDYSSTTKKSFSLSFIRRTDVMPRPAIEVKHHPSSVNNLLVEQLQHLTTCKTLHQFLYTEFSNISKSYAAELIEQLGGSFEKAMAVKDLDKKQIHQLTVFLREAHFPPPAADVRTALDHRNHPCLSPAGEYNLRLGVIKEFHPTLISTACSPPRVYEGHPFLIEAAVSVGGLASATQQKPGLSIYRFANRIPLLFEGGNDVVSVVSRAFPWSSYKMKQNTDRICVYVSLVSTKIPFKGTSKEYIGDDGGILHETIRDCIKQCCLQLKKRIVSRAMEAEKLERKKMSVRYIPDVARAIMIVWEQMQQQGMEISKQSNKKGVKRQREEEGEDEDEKTPTTDVLAVTRKHVACADELLARIRTGRLNRALLEQHLHSCVEKRDAELMMEYVVKQGRQRGEAEAVLLGCWDEQQNTPSVTLYHPNAVFKFI